LHHFDTIIAERRTDASAIAKMHEALHAVARKTSCAILNFARFNSLVCIVARSREKSRSLSLVPFLALAYRSRCAPRTALLGAHVSIIPRSRGSAAADN